MCYLGKRSNYSPEKAAGCGQEEEKLRIRFDFILDEDETILSKITIRLNLHFRNNTLSVVWRMDGRGEIRVSLTS